MYLIFFLALYRAVYIQKLLNCTHIYTVHKNRSTKNKRRKRMSVKKTLKSAFFQPERQEFYLEVSDLKKIGNDLLTLYDLGPVNGSAVI